MRIRRPSFRWSLAPPERRLSRPRALLWVVAAAGFLVAGLLVYGQFAPDTVPPIIKIELDGSSQSALTAAARSAVRWDFALIGGYGVALLCAARLAHAVFWTPSARQLGRTARLLALVAVGADIAENVLLLQAAGDRSRLLDLATAAAVVKFCALVPAAIILATALVVTVSRMVLNSRGRLRSRKLVVVAPAPLDESDPEAPAAVAAGVPESDEGARWRNGYLPADVDPLPGARTLGFCVSGGGVRSASVALGALQRLRPHLLQARYLVSVSGGGYSAGALQLALTCGDDHKHPPGAAVLRDPALALMPGSVEEDHIRRHADYLAGSTGAMAGALAVVAGVMLLSLGVLFAPAIVLGVGAGFAYDRVPLAPWDFEKLAPASNTLAYPGVRTGTWWALGLLAAVALLGFCVASAFSFSSRPAAAARRVATEAAVVGALVAGLAIGVPSLVYGASALLSYAGTPVKFGGSIGLVVLTYLAMLGSMIWKRVFGKKDTADGSTASSLSAAARAVPGGAWRLLLVLVTLGVLAAAWALVFGGVAAVADHSDARWTALVVLAVLAVVTVLLDQTVLSLHYLYRQRLARAFAVRAVQRRDGRVVAQGYPYTEDTSLDRYGQPPPNGPRVVFAATANLTGGNRAPLNGVPYTLSGDWIGGPDVGYVQTGGVLRTLREVAPPLANDLTVEAAVAISGAAFASAMGRDQRWYQTLLAVTGARLGAWLPNPAFLGQWAAAGEHAWWVPPLPRQRRLSCLLREVVGLHRHTDRLLQVTDGGHYENLGLVELLRRRCNVICCIDASGDSPPTAGTLAEAITLAREELGVEIVPNTGQLWGLVPGSGTPIPPADRLADLNARLCDRAVITARIIYPPESGLPDGPLRDGTLVVAKSLLTPTMSTDLLSYAARNSVFPHDPTSDQFFDDGKFCAYTGLGQEIGEQAKVPLSAVWQCSDTTPTTPGDFEDHKDIIRRTQ
ncbi:MAG: hypothetical protein ACXV5Q_13465 [Frankiaceae bacterium]